ncbi:LysR family transcriptional regulator [Ideonella sp. BN130291]|uniref:LysR family transcriptional regulator n=1 Tax=Ideonella sp. BN130291 TaxID=3112940 RepID=UPI002E263D3F|nr:LysR family transcriptional regulator [Ideonella sp. BN130291]
MADLDQLRVFVAVAEAGGFAPAARLLRVSPPAVTRAIAGLERHLGARLLHRTTRMVRLTEVGERFVQDARRILGELAEAEASARGAHIEPQGELAITAPVMFGRLHVAPTLLAFLAEHPKVQARVMFVDRVVHLMEEGFDVAVRIASLPDSSFTAARLGTVRRVVVASPDYLARHGAPASPAELPQHQGVGFGGSGGSFTRWTFAAPDDRVVRETAQPQMPLRLNSVDVAIEAALAGHGLARVLSYQVRDHVAAGRLRYVLQPFEPPPVPVHLVYPEGRKAAAKVRAFIDFAAARLRGHPALNEA